MASHTSEGAVHNLVRDGEKGLLNRLKNLIPTSAKLQLFKCAIIPHLTYCHLVWHFSRASDWRKLERLQERALRAVFNNTIDTYETLLQKAKLIILYNRRLQGTYTDA